MENGLVGQNMESMKHAIKDNAVTPAMMDMLRQDYVRQHGSEEGYEAFLNSLKSQDEANAMKDEMLGMRIVMDSGALVGSISTKMDSALGTISTYKGRGNI